MSAEETIASLRSEIEMLKREVADLEALIEHPGDGSCDWCGCAPASPVNLCVNCEDGECLDDDDPEPAPVSGAKEPNDG